MGLLSRKKSSPALPSSSSSSSPSRPPPLPSSRSLGPSTTRGKNESSKYGPTPSLSSLAAEEQARSGSLNGAPKPELKIADRFRSSSYDNSVSFIGHGGVRPSTPSSASLRGVPDPRLVGGSLRGGGGGIGRDQEDAILAARRRRMDGDQASVRSASSRSSRRGRRRATESRTSSPAQPIHPTDSASQPSRPAPRPTLSASTYVVPVSIPRPPTPPPPSPEKISFKASKSVRPPPSLERSVSSPANPRDSVITFGGAREHRPTTPPPPLPEASHTSSPPPQSADDSRRAAHDIVLRRGNSGYSVASTGSSTSSPPFSPPVPPLSRSPSADILLAPAAPIKRKKWDPSAAFAATPSSSPGATVSPVTGDALAPGPSSTHGGERTATAGREQPRLATHLTSRPSIITSLRSYEGAYETLYETDSPVVMEEPSPVEHTTTHGPRVIPPANGHRRPSGPSHHPPDATAAARVQLHSTSHDPRPMVPDNLVSQLKTPSRPLSEATPNALPRTSVASTPAPTAQASSVPSTTQKAVSEGPYTSSARASLGTTDRAMSAALNGASSDHAAQNLSQANATAAVTVEGPKKAPVPTDSYFPAPSPASTSPRSRPAPLSFVRKKSVEDPFEKGEPTVIPRSPPRHPPTKKNATRTLLHSDGREVNPPKGPNKPAAVEDAAPRARSPSRLPSTNGLPRSPRPSPRASPTSSPRPSTSLDLPPVLSLGAAVDPPAQQPRPPALDSTRSQSLAHPPSGHYPPPTKTPTKAHRPLPQPTPPSTVSPRPLPDPARQLLPPLQTAVEASSTSISSRMQFFEGRSTSLGQARPTSETVRREEMPRRDSALLPNSPPLTPQAPANIDPIRHPSLPGQSPPPPPPAPLAAGPRTLPSKVASAPPRSVLGSHGQHLGARDAHDSTDGSLNSSGWSASSANSSSTTVDMSSSVTSSPLTASTPSSRPTANGTPRAAPPSSFAPAVVASVSTTPYVAPSHSFSPHLGAILATSPVMVEDESQPSYPLVHHLGNRTLFEALLFHLSFPSWLHLYSTTRAIRRLISLDRDLREVVMERYLANVGYKKWDSEAWGPETLALTPNDLNAFNRAVSMPAHDFALRAQAVVAGRDQDPSTVPLLQALTRHYSRVVGRIKLQAAAQVVSVQKARKRSSAFAPPPSNRNSSGSSIRSLTPNKTGVNFSSGLYRLNHALLMRVFVPSPEGPWLSDESVVACENELKAAGVFSVLKPGDCVWNTAINEDGNAGYLLFDGYYLVDLDFQYSVTGEIPSCIDAFKYPPSYWHRVIKAAGNPLLYLDLSGPMGVEIKKNTKLVLDKSPMPAANGQPHMVQSWIHRSDLLLREIKGTVHADWAGVLVILTQGTKEAIADLGRRLDKPGKTPYRLLRERSRPGEIWIRPVVPQESLLARSSRP